MKNAAIIPARGGSKGIPKKNLINFCGKPLIYWSIKQAQLSKKIDSVWVTSDDKEILKVSEKYGANIIKRPNQLATDFSSSESAWIHAIDHIQNETNIKLEYAIGLQPTSPIRNFSDFDLAIEYFCKKNLDSLLSVCEIEDFFIWKNNKKNLFEPINYDLNDRKRRQNIEKRFLENGSFYIFKSEFIKKQNNRLGGKLGKHVMEKHKMFQIDNIEEVKLCEAIMIHYNLDKI